MIVSHKFKYVYTEFPQSGSSAIATELMSQYEGERVMYKHALFSEYVRKAPTEVESYFTFSSIRHPMDVVVSKYLKYKNDHENYLTKRVIHGRLRKLISARYERKRFKFIRDNNANFETFFFKFYKKPYAAWSIIDHHKFDFVIRFENLENHFDSVLNKLNLTKTRPLRKFNETKKEKSNYLDYYKTDRIRKYAVKIFSPYMSEWGYEFPGSWNVSDIKPNISRYRFYNFFRKFYWSYLR